MDDSGVQLLRRGDVGEGDDAATQRAARTGEDGRGAEPEKVGPAVSGQPKKKDVKKLREKSSPVISSTPKLTHFFEIKKIAVAMATP